MNSSLNCVTWWNQLDDWISALARGERKCALVHVLDCKRDKADNGQLILCITDDKIFIYAKVPNTLNTQRIQSNTRIILTGCSIEENYVICDYAQWVSDAIDKSFGVNSKHFQLQINDDNKLIELMKRHNIDSTGQISSLSKPTINFINAADNIIQNHMPKENNSFLMNIMYKNIANEATQDIKQILSELSELDFMNGKFIISTLLCSCIRNDLYGTGTRNVANDLLMHLNDGYLIEQCIGAYLQIKVPKGSKHPIFYLYSTDELLNFATYWTVQNTQRWEIAVHLKMNLFEMGENHHTFVSMQDNFSRNTWGNKNIYGFCISHKRLIERKIINIPHVQGLISIREFISNKRITEPIDEANIKLWSDQLITCYGQYNKPTTDELKYFISLITYYCNNVRLSKPIEEGYETVINAFKALKYGLKRFLFDEKFEGKNIKVLCDDLLVLVLGAINYEKNSKICTNKHGIQLVTMILQVYDRLLIKSKSEIIRVSLLNIYKFRDGPYPISSVIMDSVMQFIRSNIQDPELNIQCINVMLHSVHQKMDPRIQQSATDVVRKYLYNYKDPISSLKQWKRYHCNQRDSNIYNSYSKDNKQENKENKNEDNDESDTEMENLENEKKCDESDTTATEYETELEKELAKCGYSMTLAPIGIGASCNVYRISDKNVISYAAKVIDKCVTDYKNNDDKDNGYIQKKQKKRDDLIERERYFFSIFKQNPNDHILKCIDIIETEENVIFIYEYANGRDLHMYMDDKLNEGVYPFCLDDVRNIMKQAILGVMSMHQNGIIHKDLKLSNLFVFIKNNKELRIKIGDFGLCEKIEIKDSKYKNITLSAYCGTKYYWPPEIIKHENYDKKADIWTLGIICYQLLFAKYPFASDQDSIEKAFNNIQHPKPILSYYDQSIGSAIAFCKQCLVKDPKERKNICQSMKHDFFNDKLNDNKCFV
eukprot:533672_1